MLFLSFLFAIQIPLVLLSVVSFDGRRRLYYEQVEQVAHRLNLLRSDKEGRLESSHGLPWKRDILIPANQEDILLQDIDFDKYVETGLIKASEKGQILIMRSGARTMKPTLSVNRSRYGIIGGVVQVQDQNHEFLHYSAFTVDENGILCDGLGHISFIKEYSECMASVLLKMEVDALPHFIAGADGTSYSLVYEELFYQDAGPLECPYGFRCIGFNNSLVDQDYAKIALGIESNLPWTIVKRGIRLVQFIQVWNAVRPRRRFVNDTLREMSTNLLVLKDDDVEEKRSLLLKACEFMQFNACDDSRFEWFPFLSILKEQDSTAGQSFFPDLEGPLDSSLHLEEGVCNNLSDELMFFVRKAHEEVAVPYLLNVPCRGNSGKVVMFRLVAQISIGDGMVSFDIGRNSSSRDGKILQIAHSHWSHFRVSNLPVSDPQNLTFSMLGGLFVYQHVQHEEQVGRMMPQAAL